MRRIGIMGGTFNPIHNGHLAIAQNAREQFALEKVLFMPSGVPYMKEQGEVLPIEVRCEMTRLAIKGITGFALSKIEAADAAQRKNTYTCDTLQKLKHADPEAAYYFILGADSLYALEDWKSPELIFQSCTVLAAVRTESASTQQGDVSGNPRERLNMHKTVSAGKIPCICRDSGICGHGCILHADSGKGAAGRTLQGLLPEAVEAYIRKNRLYEKDS